MPLRIMHVVDSLGRGGLENGLVNLIQRTDSQRFEHSVYALRRLGVNADRLPFERVRVMCRGEEHGGRRIEIAALIRAIREIKPDVVHSRNWGALEAVVAGRWVGSCALVHSEHGLDSVSAVKEPRRRIWFRRLAFVLADRVLSVSHQLRDLHARRTGFAPEKITVIHNGVDSRRFGPNPASRARLRQEFGISDSDFCVGCVGSLVPVKDHTTLLQAIHEFEKSCGDWRLLIVGDGPELPKLHAFVAGHPSWKERVNFVGSSDRVPELLTAMDVYVLPSLTEGISNSLLEAMATGLPVVVTETGGNPEVVGRDSGLLFPVSGAAQLTEHLRALRAKPEWCLQLGQRARLRVHEEFSLDAMVRNYEQLYSSLAPGLANPARAYAGA